MRSGGVLGLGLLALGGCAQLLGLETPQPGDGGVNDGPHLANDVPVDVATTSTACPTGYTSMFGAGTYRFANVSTKWTDAMVDCINDALPNSSKRTHLVVVTSDQELSVALGVTQIDIWVGLTDRATEGNYQWVTDQMTNYPPASGQPWGQNEPSASSPETDCVSLDMFGQLVVQDCSTSPHRYLCECDGFAADPTHY